MRHAGNPHAAKAKDGSVLNIATQWELAIWSAMTGAILLLAVVAGADLLVSRSVPAARGLAFLLLTGGSSVLMTRLPELLVPALSAELLLPIRASFGPLSGALALTYLGVWVGVARDDRLIHWTVTGGALALVLAAVILAVLAFVTDLQATQLIGTAAAVNAVSVLLAGIVAVRCFTLGDGLARWMVVACICLAGMVSGLYSEGLQAAGPYLWAFTAVCTIGYFLIVIALTLQRNRELRKLKRLAQSKAQPDLGGNMTLGSRLVPHVEDALWRSSRVGRSCVVAAISIANLYELGEVAGHGVDQQILVALMARIRRIVGFRNVVGLYHPRCFMLVVSAVQDPRRSELLAARLLYELRKPVTVGEEQNRHDFEPSIGIGLVRISGTSIHAVGAMNRAEKLALEAVNTSAGVLGEDFSEGQPAPAQGEVRG